MSNYIVTKNKANSNLYTLVVRSLSRMYELLKKITKRLKKKK